MTLISSLIGFFKGFNKDPFVDKTVKILLRRWFRYAKWPLRTCLRHSQVSKCTQTSYDIGPIFYSKLVQKSNFYLFIICLEIIPCYENQFAITHSQSFFLGFSQVVPVKLMTLLSFSPGTSADKETQLCSSNLDFCCKQIRGHIHI